MKGTSQELDKMAKYSALKKEVDANVALYNSLYGRIKEAGISAASKSADIQIVDPARVPDVRFKPRRMLNMVVGLLAALVGGIGLAFLYEEFDNKLRSPGGHSAMDWKREYLHYSCHSRGRASWAA